MKFSAVILIALALNASAAGYRLPVGSGTVGLQPVVIYAKASGAHDYTFAYPRNARQFAWTMKTMIPIRSTNWFAMQSWPRGTQPSGKMIIHPAPGQKYRMDGN
jgi:hypothetical protein